MNSAEFLQLTEDFELDEGCFVCQVTKRAHDCGREPTVAELQEAFMSAEKSLAVSDPKIAAN